ncbi:fungal specific transcription factor domain-containing [Trichoderma arundinaceum]|uniref:Fungal specific transcription factor domain-containing n=1 Tax=Trichoderma arundinaceum TaxID=490622 RepID=A0A395NLH1_TRIAR|nr:fungal specific transcription factor domain-containing [Trichoderma arundinaceum]
MPNSGISQFTSVFRATDAHRVKRSRQTVSCTACQRRKSRCDRQHPCGACEKRGGGGACSYGPVSSSVTADRATAGSSRRDVQLKLNQLEQMVRGLAENRLSKMSSGLGNGHEERQRSTGGDKETPIESSELETSYHGATSWTALVESIHDIQYILGTDRDSNSPDAAEMAEPEVVLGDVPPITIKEVMESLPPRQEADKLIMAYFKAKFIAVIFIHTHQFKRRYEAFWADPSSAGFLWISILFSILSIGTMITSTKGSDSLPSSTSSSPSLSVPDSRFYMTKAAQCLIAGQYFKGKRFSVEALLMHAHSRNVQKLDSDSSLWTLYGLVVRLAQRQGYHRESTKVSSNRAMTPFEAEMRRRTWFLIQSTDLLFSFQNGMPPIITQEACDVDHPTNLTDDDFDEDTVSLPAPRPPTDPIPVLACITKSKLCRVMRRVVRHALSVTPGSYSETLTLNQELQDWHDSVPACLHIRTIRNTSFTDANYTIMHRLMLELMYLKSLCVLNRPYLTTHKHEVKYDSSRQICRESALEILEIQAELDIETGPGGRMYEERFMISNLTLHHFLLAAMVVCLDLSESSDISPEDRVKRIATLRTAYTIWSARSATSSDAFHASRVLRAILSRIDPPGTNASTSSGPMISTPSSSLPQSYGSVPTTSADMMQQAMTLDSSEIPVYNTADDAFFGDGAGAVMPSFEDMFANTDMFDWSSLDQYIQPDSRSWRQFFADTGL